MLGLYAKDATGRQNGVVDLGQTTVGARQNEIVKHVGTALPEDAANAYRSELGCNDADKMIRGRTKHEGRE